MLTLIDEIKQEIQFYLDKVIDAQATLDTALTLDSASVGNDTKKALINSARSIKDRILEQLYNHIALIAKKDYVTGSLV